LILTDSATDVVAVGTADGSVKWRVNLFERVREAVPDRYLVGSRQPPERFSPVALATPDCVYVQTSYGIHGMTPANGREQWRVYLDTQEDDGRLHAPGGLALTERMVWASYGRPGTVYAADLRQGRLKTTRTDVPEDHPWRPVVAGSGTVAFTSQIVWSTNADSGVVVGINGRSGPDWQFPGLASDGAAAFSAIATDGRRIVACEAHEQRNVFAVFVLRATSGGLEWVKQDPIDTAEFAVGDGQRFQVCHPAVAGDTVIVGYGMSDQGTGQGILSGRSLSDGNVRWQTRIPVAPQEAVVAGERLYVGGPRGDVLAFETGDS
jgi:outer membrane protein assembly factor BamB